MQGGHRHAGAARRRHLQRRGRGRGLRGGRRRRRGQRPGPSTPRRWWPVGRARVRRRAARRVRRALTRPAAHMIKYLGSKRRLVPVLEAICAAAHSRTALDLFTGTTRVAQAFKRHGAHVTAVDTARYAEAFARCYVATDACRTDRNALGNALADLNSRPPTPGYFTDTFCVQARYLQPDNGARVDAIRDAIASDYGGTPLEPLLLTSLVEAADRVDSTTGVQMAYVKEWAPRSFRPLELRVPELLGGGGAAVRADACE